MTSITLERNDLTPEEHRILEGGLIRISPWTNSNASWVRTAQGLVKRGFMTGFQQYDPPYTELRVTPAGRNAYVSYGHPYVPTA